MPPALDLRHGSLADFLAWERQKPERYERVGRVVRMMTRGTLGHNKITLNCVRALASRLDALGCSVFASDVKVVSPGDASCIQMWSRVRADRRPGDRTL